MRRRLDALVYGMIRERRAQRSSGLDVLSMLLTARDEDGSGMNDRQVHDEVMTLLLAGHETTAVALVWTLTLLARHPHTRERLELELDTALSAGAPTIEDLARVPSLLPVVKGALRVSKR